MTPAPATGSEDELIELAREDPEAALSRCAELRAATADSAVHSSLDRVVGVALRFLGRVDEAVEQLTTATATAQAAGDRAAVGRADLSLGAALLQAGRFEDAIEVLERARHNVMGPDLVDVDSHLAVVHARLGDARAARGFLDAVIRTCSDRGWAEPLADGLANRGLFLVYAGDLAGAEQDLIEARRMFDELGQGLAVAQMDHNLGYVAARRGDLRQALAQFARAERRLGEIGAWSETIMAVDLSEALLAAGLAAEAAERAGAGAAEMEADGAIADAWEARLLQAHALARDEQFVEAEAVARAAATGFDAQGRPGWAAEAGVVVARCALANGDQAGSVALLRRLVNELAELSRGEAWREATLLLADALARSGDPEAADLVDVVAGSELPLHQAAVRDLVRARLLARDRRHDAAVALARSTLRRHAEVRSTLDAVDVRAAMGAHTAALRDVALSSAAIAGDVDAVHEMAEWGALSAVEPPPVSPPGDSAAAAVLAELRRTAAELRAAERDLEPVDELAGQVMTLQRELADATRRLAGPDRAAAHPAPMDEVRAGLQGRSYVRFVAIGDEVHRLVDVDGELHHDIVAPLDRTVTAATMLARSLAREIRGSRSERAMAAARQGVSEAAEALGADLFAGIESSLGAEVVVVASPSFDLLAWQLLPVLRGRAVTVAPAAGLVGRPEASGSASVLLVAGPGLGGAVDEVERLGRLHRSATVLVGGGAGAEQVRSSLAGRDVVHVAAHARLERGQPLLSSIELADGPLYVHDLFSVADPPAQVIFSACESARGSDVLGGEILGLGSALLTRGSRAVVGCKVPLPDNEPTHDAMERIHRLLIDGRSAAQALGQVADGDDAAARIAGSMITLGR